MGSSPRPTNALEPNWILMSTSPVVWWQSSQVTIMAVPMTSYGSITSLDGMMVMTGSGPLSMASSPPQGLCYLCEPGLGHWGLVVGCGLEWHKFPGWSRRYSCLCSSPHGCGGRPAFTAGQRQGSPWTGPVTTCVALWWFLGDNLHQLWWGYFCPWGWHHGHEDISFHESGEGSIPHQSSCILLTRQ